ncbi:MAG: hypothetical protein M1282_18655 [Chloroflexi bacterium]|nr:hypothetical protein [Chloroflexota bacterium]
MQNFLIGLEACHHPELAGRPLALLDPNERVLDVSPEARSSGVYSGMTPRQALTRCPDLIVREADISRCRAEQGALIATIANCGLKVEESGWGSAYLDLSPVATTSDEVKPIVVDMAKQVRRVLGDSQKAMGGWDTGKFTARAAATFAKPNSLQFIDRKNEEQFLNPLPITLLPLPPYPLQRLYRLGIETLGQFAGLPSSEVWRQFGQAGKVAQRWAKGKDDRPVCQNVKTVPQAVSLDFDPPTALHTRVLETTLNALRPHLIELENQMSGCRRLLLELKFDNGETRAIDCVFVEPVGDDRRLRATLSHELQILNWPAELATLRFTLLEIGELVARQLTLFDMDEDLSPLLELTRKLYRRYGAIFFQARVTDERHPLSGYRVTLSNLSSAY